MPRTKKKAAGKTSGTSKKASPIPAPLCIGGILSTDRLLSITTELRSLVINNANRIKGFRMIADKLGTIETFIIDSVGLKEDDKQADAFKKPPSDWNHDAGDGF